MPALDLAVAGFDWDEGNRAKCAKHRVSIEEVEALFTSPGIQVHPDLQHSLAEARDYAIGRTSSGRAMLVVFTIRVRGNASLIGPISARYMHAREVERYEKDAPDLRDR